MDGLKLMLEQCGNAMMQEQFITDGRTTTTLHWLLSRWDYLLVRFMIAKLPIMEVFMKNWSLSSIEMACGLCLWKCEQNIEDYKKRHMAQDATSMRQSAEWGMQAFQSSMQHIKDRTKFETRGEHKVTLSMMILLYNYQAKTVGINQ